MTVKEEKNAFPMSFAQKRLWFLDQLEPGGSFYNLPANALLKGRLDVAAFERSINEIIRRHESLRTTFAMMDGEPVQLISESLPLELPVVDLTNLSQPEQAGEIQKMAAHQVQRSFNLSEGPLLHATLVRLSALEHVLLISMHHIVSDAWSMGVFIRELATLYKAYAAGGDSPLMELPIQYADFASWQHAWLQGPILDDQLRYWKQQLAGAPAPTWLPTDKPRPAKRSYRAGSVRFEISPKTADRLNQIRRQSGATLFMVLLSAFAVLLSKYSGQKDIVVGSPIANRNRAEIEPLIGFFVNTLIFRSDLSADPTFHELLGRVRKTALDAYAHQDVPFEQLVEAMQPERSLSVTPLFQVLFVLQNAPFKNLAMPGLTLHPLTEYETEMARYDLELYLWEASGSIYGGFAFKKDVFETATMERMAEQFKNLLDGIAADPGRRISKIPLLSEAGRQRILARWSNNDMRQDPRNDRTLHELFEKQVKRNPDAPALVFADQQLTYGELNLRAARIARCLRKNGPDPGELVGICMERSIEMIVGILGVLKSGCAYLPMDPSWPADRLAFILKDARASVVLTKKDSAERLPESGVHIVALDRPWDGNSGKAQGETVNAATPGSPAYAIYTSGSTGEPKAVLIEHRNATHLVRGLKERIYRRYDGRLNVALVAPFVFDASVQQIFGALLQGHCLHIVPEDARLDGAALLEFYRQNNIDVSDGTPAHIQLLLEAMHGSTTSIPVRHYIIGGEALPGSSTARFLRKFSGMGPVITNVYGPAECTVDVTSFDVSAETIDSIRVIPIGRPLPCARIYIVDDGGNLQPEGVAGEIYVGGGQVGAGYLNRPELTDERFVPNPFQREEMWYRTGDLGKWRPDGTIEFLGRTDRQVKLRGFRIEPGEIEKKLLAFKMIRESGVGAQEEIVRCTRCVLPAVYPGVEFDKDGACNVCRRYAEYKTRAADYFKDADDFKRLAEKARSRADGQHDCLLLFSGGKDSAYVLHRLCDMGLKVLTFTFDNGYISDTAFDNIGRMTSALKVDSIIGTTQNMPEIFLESLQADSTVCTGCFKALTTISTQIAFERRIPMVITGLSRGQIFHTKLQALFEEEIFDPGQIEEKLHLFRKMYHAGKDRISQLLDIDLPEDTFSSIEFVDFFRYDDASVETVRNYLQDKDKYWRQPEDTGFCSTNCKINDAGILVHRRINNYHNYAAPVSWDVRLGRQTRADGLAELDFNADRRQKAEAVLAGLGYEPAKITQCAVVVKKDTEEFEHLCAYFVSDRKIAARQLRRYLSEILPNYMIPGHFVRMDALPLTKNGKVDWRALPDPVQVRPDLDAPLVDPCTPTQEAVAAIWCDVLNLKQVGIHDDFFELGGHSLMAARVISRVRQDIRVEIPLRILFEKQTIAELAEWIVLEQLKQADEESMMHILAEVDALPEEEAVRLLRSSSDVNLMP